jgi:CHAT domain
VGLVLRAENVASPWRWRWLLSDEETGEPLASHQVNLDPAGEEVAAFRDLYGYARWRAAPDRRLGDQMRIVRDAGAWAGRALIGEAVGAAIAAEAPVTLRVEAPPPADQALMWPIELAHVSGRPLAARGDVSLVYDIVPSGTTRRKEPVRDVLRVLAVFSQPTQTGTLALRQERYALTQLIRRFVAHERAVVELSVVQYGVTRQRIAEIIDSGDGWDVLHLAGHGGPRQFLLEQADGSPDLLTVTDLIELLRPSRHRLKLAFVSACESAAETVAETLRLVGLDDQAGEAAEAGPDPGQAETEASGVARALVRDLDCAVVAMRYPVTDEFAIALGAAFYERLLIRGQPVDVAAGRAVAEAAGTRGTVVRQALSLATPGVFGSRAAGLKIEVPRGQPRLDPAVQKMAYFPDEPERFVGRTVAMATASAALASGSGKTTVLLYGMAGSGKTACALELAYRHQDRFPVIAFWQASTRGEEWEGALASLALSLELQLRDYQFTMAEHLGTEAALHAFLPRFRQVMRNNGLLLVLDNLETLLTPDGEWLDPRWELLMTALTSHGGESRLVMTSQIAPAGLGVGGVTLPVHALSLDESAALARELPHLRGLLHAEDGPDPDEGPVRGPVSPDIRADRERLRRVLRVVQGHPKLLEFADAAAVDRSRLDAQLAAAEAAAAGQQLEAFFCDGTSALGSGEFLHALTGWTAAALTVLSPEARLMAEFLACLEDNDRLSLVIEATWPELWHQLGRHGDPPAPGALLDVLAAAALAEAEPVPIMEARGGAAPTTGVGSAPVPLAYRLHPGVAAAIAAVTVPGVRETADAALAAFWETVVGQAREGKDGENSEGVVRAGLAAAPYLLRRGDWDTASALLEQAIIRDSSPGTVQVALPSLRRIAAVGTLEDVGVLARALGSVDPSEAERLLHGALDAAATVGDHRALSSISGQLASQLIDAGRLQEALAVSEQTAEYTARAGLGPWTQLADQARRLQVLGLMGEHERVLAETAALRTHMGGLPVRRAANETVAPWNVREMILDAARSSALATRDWQQCLNLNAGIEASKRQRGAGLHEVTRTRFNDTSPLIGLGRMSEASRLLDVCQQVFEEHADITMLAKVFTTRADLETELGHKQAAADLEQTALRLSYVRPEPRDIAISHHNVANDLWNLGGNHTGQRAHRLAAALIFRLADMAHSQTDAVRELAAELRAQSGGDAPPVTVAQVVATAEQVEGVHLAALLAALEPDPKAVEAALAEILDTAAALALDPGNPSTRP